MFKHYILGTCTMLLILPLFVSTSIIESLVLFGGGLAMQILN